MTKLLGKKKGKKEMKKFQVSLLISGIKGTSTLDVEERLRNFIFVNRRYWKLDILDIQEEAKEVT